LAAQVHATLRDGLGNRPFVRLGPSDCAFAITDADRAQVIDRVESLRKTIEGLMIEVKGKTVRATVSIGGVELENETDAPADALVEAALDTAFAAARRAEAAGGNRIDVLSKEVARAEPDSEAAAVLARINEAIDKQRFVLLFQPIISLRGDSDEHYEVFLRMLDEDGRHIAPNEFLRTAIQHGVA